MDQVIVVSTVLLAFRGVEKLLIVNDDYLHNGARIILGIIITLIDTIVTIAMVDEDMEHCKKAYEKAKKAKKSFFDYVDHEKVISLHICVVAVFSKICLWSGLDFWRSFLIPTLVVVVIFVEICTISGDLKKYNEIKSVKAQKKGHIGVFIGVDENEAQNFEQSYRTFNINYAKILGTIILFLRFIFYPYVNSCDDSWNMVNYLILDLLLLFSVLKDYDLIKDNEKYILFGANLFSLCLYMNLKLLMILPFYIGMAYLMKKFGHKIFCFVYLFIIILLNQYLTWIFHQQSIYQLHFVSKMIIYGLALIVFLMVYKTDRRLLVFAKLFKSIFYLFTLLVVLVLLSELESNSYGTDLVSHKIKQEFAFLCLLLCLEVWIFVRLHLHYSTPKKPEPKKDENKFGGVQSKEKEEKEKDKQPIYSFTNFMLKLLQISWKDDFMMKGQLKQIANIQTVIAVVLLNLFFFNEKLILIFINYLLLNRWVYIIKGLNDAKLYFWHHAMYVFQFLSKYFLKDIYSWALLDVVGKIFYWKKNLLTNLALNFSNIRQNIDGRSQLLADGNDFEIQFHDVRNHHMFLENDDLENEVVLMFILSFINIICMLKRGREWKKGMKSIRSLLIPLWVYILVFEEYDFYINSMLTLQIVQTFDEQFIKANPY